MSRERHKQKPCEADSINALHRDGQARSSDETAVMAAERRGLVTLTTDDRPTARQEEPSNVAKPFAIAEGHNHDFRYVMVCSTACVNSESHLI